MDKIIKDIRAIIKLSRKILSELKGGDIRKAQRHLELIIAFDIDELKRLQGEEGNRSVIDECLIVLKEAKKALKDTKSFQTLGESRQLVEHIEKIEEWEFANIRLRSHHLVKLHHHLDEVPEVFALSDRDYIEQIRETTSGEYPNNYYTVIWFLNMREILRRLRDNPTLKFELVTGSDSLCALCGHRKNCVDPEHQYYAIANQWDEKSDKDHPHLKKGSKYDVALILEIYRRISQKKKS